jgi:hypothetical protein
MTVSTSDLIDRMLANTAVLTGDPVHSTSYRAGYLESTLKEILLRSPEAVNIVQERIQYQNNLIEQAKEQ